MKVLMADRSYLRREGLKKVLTEIGLTAIYETDKTDLLLDNTELKEADILLCEAAEQLTSNNLLQSLRQDHPNLKILLLCEEHSLSKFVKYQSYVEGILLDTSLREEFAQALVSIRQGDKYYCPQLADLIAQLNAASAVRKTSSALFSERENEILGYILKGRSNEQIADILYLSEKTIATHKRNIMKKARVKKTSDLILFSIEKGLMKEY
jgi:DNA-binding NarL/FixJ family response regulator